MQEAAQPPAAAPPPPPPPASQLPPFVALSAVAAAIEESAKRFGCAKCRYSRGGCKRCRAPGFRPRGGPMGQPTASLPDGQPRARRVVKSKRPRKAPAAQAGSKASSEPLLHVLRRQLQGLQTQGSDAATAAPPAPAAAGAPPAPAAEAPQAAAAAATPGVHAAAGAGGNPGAAPPQQGQQQKRAAEGGGHATGQRPAKFLKADPLLLSSLQQEQAPAAQAAAGPAGKREASSEPSPSARRPAKRLRAAQPLPLQPHGHIPAADAPGAAEAAAAAAGAAAAAADADMAAAGAASKRPAAEQRAQRPAKFRRVAQEQQQAQQAHGQQHGQQQQHGRGHAHGQQQRRPGSPAGSGGSEHMEVDVLSPRKRAAAAALERAATGGGASPAGAAFLAKLEENMQLRHAERQRGAASPAANPLLQSATKRRKQSSPKASAVGAGLAAQAPSLAASQGAAAAAAADNAPDPRLCLWEPPVSPYGLLEEELFDDPWKLLVACMLLNKTSGAQVRRVIWDLFALCPTPAAAMAADVAAISSLIQPLGLFRKRAAAIQQLSHEFLFKQWRDPTELFGIGKYAADAYHMFCRGRWQEVQPDDKDLKKYREWLEQTGGLGTGLTRHRTMPAAPPAAPGGA